jgi:hypothetical protein
VFKKMAPRTEFMHNLEKMNRISMDFNVTGEKKTKMRLKSKISSKAKYVCLNSLVLLLFYKQCRFICSLFRDASSVTQIL